MSDGFSVEVSIKDNSDEYLRILGIVTENALDACGWQAEGHAADYLESYPRRVDTGLLRNSITHAISGQEPTKKAYESDPTDKNGKPVVPIKKGSYAGLAPESPAGEKTVYIGTNVEYAVYVHNATSKLKPPNRFLKNAVTNHGNEYKAIIEKQLKDG